MDKRDIAKDLTIAFLEKKPQYISSAEDMVTVYEKFYEAVHRSGSLVDYDWIQSEDFVRNNK
ncbi:hypothetical protein [Bacillus anthracis]|uniref:hypothetical protein n=1 Tax=Bacillus anthracis TaxID=1392 RepID=UPI0008FDE1BE|nr:hypothetical protein [Bacillus anthracis]OJD86971.1 hypothetical protein A9486_20305 [Bacillus anthracis]